MTTMDVRYSGDVNALVRGWRAFKLWRRSRPFWGGLFTLLSALELWSIPFLQDAIHLHMQIKGIAGVSTMAMGPIMVMLALAMWIFPDYRVFAGVATLICALLSLVVSNFGGFLLGMLLGTIGGGLGFSWSPRYTAEQLAAKARAEQAYRDALAGDVPAAASTPLGVPAEGAAFVTDGATAEYPAQDARPEEFDPAPAFAAGASASFDAEVPPPLPAAAPAGPPASPLNRQRTTEPTLTVATAAADPEDVVPPLPSAEDTHLGA